jgi:HEAT repeat protein
MSSPKPNVAELLEKKDLEGLGKALHHEDTDVRREAAQALGDIGEAAFGPLTEALKHEDPDVRLVAVDALGRLGESGTLGRLGESGAVAVLVAALEDRDAGVRETAAEALHWVGAAAVAPLAAALGHETRYVRWRAAVALGELGDPAAVAPLAGALNNEDGYVRRRAALALHELNDPSTVGVLVSALGNEDRYVRRRAALALGELGDEAAVALGRLSVSAAIGTLAAALTDEDEHVRLAGLETIAELGDSDALVFLSTEREDPNPSELDVSGGGLDQPDLLGAGDVSGGLSDQLEVEQLLGALAHADWSVRQRAARVLGELGDRSAARALLGAAKEDEDPEVREEAVRAIRRVGDPVFGFSVFGQLEDRDWGVRQMAIRTLVRPVGLRIQPKVVNHVASFLHSPGSDRRSVRAEIEDLATLGDRMPVECLMVDLLLDADEDLRLETIREFGGFGDPIAVELLTAALKCEDSVLMRLAAAEALGELGDPAGVGPLVEALGDEGCHGSGSSGSGGRKWSLPVGMVAAIALCKLDDRAGLDVLAAEYLFSGDPRDRAGDVVAAAAANVSTTTSLLDIWDADAERRRAAAEALGEFGDASVVDPLTRALKEDGYPSVRAAAARALGEIGDSAAVDALLGAFKDEVRDVRAEVPKALGEIGGAPAVDALLGALKDEGSDVRTEVAKALGKTGDCAAVDALIGALQGKNESVRSAAARALGEIGNSAAVDALLGVLHDEEGYVRKEVAKALGEIGDPAAVDALLGALKDGNSDAAEALGKIGDAAAVAPLAVIVADQDNHKYLRVTAVEALGRLAAASDGDPAAESALRGRLADPDRVVALRALAALKSIDAQKVGKL